MRKGIAIVLLILIITACGNKTTYIQVGLTPAKVALTLPANNAPCLSGTVISATQSAVLFTWAASANTDSYDLYVKNLLTGNIQVNTVTAPQLNVTLLSNTPYAWYVVSKTSTGPTTTQSDTWKFYNSGQGVVSYAPFPADLIAPGFGQNITATNGKINLVWNGSSVSGNIAYYNVFFGTTASAPKLPNNITDSFLNNVTVTSKTTYYWHVMTVDFNGNYTDSELYQFVVN